MGFLQLVEEGNLGGDDDTAGFVEGEPATFVDFGEGEHAAGVAGPFDLDGIAGDGSGVEIACYRPGIDSFAAFLADGAEGLELAIEGGACFFAEFADGGVEGGFAGVEFAFGDGPGAGVFVFPEGSAGVD